MTHGFQNEYEQRGQPRLFWPAVAAIVSVLVLGGYGLSVASEELGYLQAQEDDRIEAQRQASQELRKQQALQDQCGGPEATVLELAQGGYQCLDANGRRTKSLPGAPT